MRASLAAAARFRSSSAVRKPTRYWASSRVRAAVSMSNAVWISSPNLPYFSHENCLLVS